MVKFRNQSKIHRSWLQIRNIPSLLGCDFMNLFEIVLSNVVPVNQVSANIISNGNLNEYVQNILKRFANVFKNDLGLYIKESVGLNLIEENLHFANQGQRH